MSLDQTGDYTGLSQQCHPNNWQEGGLDPQIFERCLDKRPNQHSSLGVEVAEVGRSTRKITGVWQHRHNAKNRLGILQDSQSLLSAVELSYGSST